MSSSNANRRIVTQDELQDYKSFEDAFLPLRSEFVDAIRQADEIEEGELEIVHPIADVMPLVLRRSKTTDSSAPSDASSSVGNEGLATIRQKGLSIFRQRRDAMRQSRDYRGYLGLLRRYILMELAYVWVRVAVVLHVETTVGAIIIVRRYAAVGNYLPNLSS
jgi:hypothetical protein